MIINFIVTIWEPKAPILPDLATVFWPGSELTERCFQRLMRPLWWHYREKAVVRPFPNVNPVKFFVAIRGPIVVE